MFNQRHSHSESYKLLFSEYCSRNKWANKCRIVRKYRTNMLFIIKFLQQNVIGWLLGWLKEFNIELEPSNWVNIDGLSLLLKVVLRQPITILISSKTGWFRTTSYVPSFFIRPKSSPLWCHQNDPSVRTKMS